MIGALAIIHPPMPLPAPQASTGGVWHILRTKVQGELKALRWLSYEPNTLYLPLERKMVSHGRNRKRPAWRPIFPGYLFINLPPDFDGWDHVRRAPGVDDFMRWSGRYATLAEEGMDVLRGIEANLRNPKKAASPWKVGQRVLVLEDAGPWAGYKGLIQRLDKPDKEILLSILPAGIGLVSVPPQWIKLDDG